MGQKKNCSRYFLFIQRMTLKIRHLVARNYRHFLSQAQDRCSNYLSSHDIFITFELVKLGKMIQANDHHRSKNMRSASVLHLTYYSSLGNVASSMFRTNVEYQRTPVT